MKAARLHGYNTLPVLQDVPVPEISSASVLVRVAAASLNPLDVQLQKGVMHHFFPLSFPYTMGTDLAGTVEDVGSDVVGWSKGDRVVARTDPTNGGAFADFVVVPASYLAKAPSSASLDHAAGIGTAGGTAWQALFEVADIQKGQSILVHAGAGGVGSFAIQLARSAGARVIATASGNGIDIARRLGADQVIDYRSDNFADKVSDLDMVLDAVGGQTQQSSFGVLRKNGILVGITAPPDEALAQAHGVTGIFFPHMSDARRLAKVVESIDAGIKILIDRTVVLGKLDEALAHQASGHARGKILLTP